MSKPNYLLVEKDMLEGKVLSAVQAFLQTQVSGTNDDPTTKPDPHKLAGAIMTIFQDLPTCVDNPPKDDVLCDRDPKANKAAGTKFARSIVAKHVESYDKLHHGNLKKLKGDMMRRIVEEIKNPVPGEPPKKFWRKVWIPMTYEEERRRVGHWLRDDPGSFRDTKKVRKRLKLSEDEALPVSSVPTNAAKGTTDPMTLVVEAAVELERRSLVTADENKTGGTPKRTSGQGTDGISDAKKKSPQTKGSPANSDSPAKAATEEPNARDADSKSIAESPKTDSSPSKNGNDGKTTGKRTRTQPSRAKSQK